MKYVNRFRVAPGSKVRLKDIDPAFKDRHHESKKEAAEELEQDRNKLRELQELLYADGRCSLLIVLQGMDTAGKDGTIGHILGSMNPQGCRVVSLASKPESVPSHATQNSRSSNHPSAPGHSRSASSSSPQQAKNWPGFVGSTLTRMLGSGFFMVGHLRRTAWLDFAEKFVDNYPMTLTGHIQNGVVVFDVNTSLPEGTQVTVFAESPSQPAATQKRRVDFPLVREDGPPIVLTNEIIAEIFEAEDVEYMKGMWKNASPS